MIFLHSPLQDIQANLFTWGGTKPQGYDRMRTQGSGMGLFSK